jgi:hypothetical protein
VPLGASTLWRWWASIDLDVVAVAQRARRHVEQLEHDVHADAHVGRQHDRDVLRVLRDARLLRVAEAGGADHRLHAALAARARCASVPSGRVKSISTSRRRGRRRGRGDRTPLALPRKPRRPGRARAAGDVERAGEHQVVGRLHRLDQHVAHAPEAPAIAMRSGVAMAQRGSSGG